MSIFVTSLVWKFSRAEGSTLLTALAIADFADDEGRAYPAVSTLAAKARISERSAQYAVRELIELGELLVEPGTGPRGTNTYCVQVQNLRGANSAGVQPGSQGGATGCTQTIINRQKKKSEKAPPPPVTFDASTGKFEGISGLHRGLWASAYPAINADVELGKAAMWLIANPANRKSNYLRFLTNWLARAQDKAPPITGRSPALPTRREQREAFAASFFQDVPQATSTGDAHVIDVDAREIRPH